MANFFRSQLYVAGVVPEIGMDILVKNESVSADNFNAHGGLFKVKGVVQQLIANSLNTAISVSETAGEVGTWGMALLAAYMMEKERCSLGDWLDTKVFGMVEKEVSLPNCQAVDGLNKYFELYKSGLCANDKIL